MRNNNAELIRRILEGDDAAFTDLVRKYQKRVHALAWRKIGDFHIAEDITQEAFSTSLSEISDVERSESVSGVALCHRQPPLPCVAPKETDPDTTIGGDGYNNGREHFIFETRRC